MRVGFRLEMDMLIPVYQSKFKSKNLKYRYIAISIPCRAPVERLFLEQIWIRVAPNIRLDASAPVQNH